MAKTRRQRTDRDERIKELEAENQSLRRRRTGNAIAAVVVEGIRWTGTCVIAYLGYRCIDSLAGQHTDATFDFSIFAELKPREIVLLAAALLSVGYGRLQKKLRQTTIERLQARIRKDEKKTDPKRSSSDLTPRGETNPEDLP